MDFFESSPKLRKCKRGLVVVKGRRIHTGDALMFDDQDYGMIRVTYSGVVELVDGDVGYLIVDTELRSFLYARLIDLYLPTSLLVAEKRCE